jgi:hypothetical protein
LVVTEPREVGPYKDKQKTVVFNPNQNSPGKKLKLVIGDSHPPKKVATKLGIKPVLQYSPKKNKAKPMDEYSTLNPATSSASGKSNGALFVSARVEIQKNNAGGNN